jgi:hypothetical protein
MMPSKYLLPLLGLLVCTGSACTKDAINQKPDISLAVPSTISDFQQMLDGLDGGDDNFNAGFNSYRSLTDYLCDEYSVSNSAYTTYFLPSPFALDVLTWNKQMFNTFSTQSSVYEWNKQYTTVLNANLALEGLAAIKPDPVTQVQWNLAEGMALFFRGQMFYNLAQFWAKPYNTATASSDPGIVLKVHSDISEPSIRSTVQQTYDQIISDLKGSVPLLPNSSVANDQLSKARPSLAAAYGMLARTYLAMGDSASVLKYADSALELYSTLMDYNTTTTFIQFNAETVYYSYDNEGSMGSFFGPWRIDSSLVNTYDASDLRKTLYFTYSAYVGGYAFSGDYSGHYVFTGIAVDELYLMRAEAYARTGNAAAAMSDLNTLLIKRYKTGDFTPRTASGPADALAQVLAERKKELIQRGLRWTDLRRLNTDPRFAVTLTRTANGVTYTLPPGDSRYTLQIPNYVIDASGGTITQNP